VFVRLKVANRSRVSRDAELSPARAGLSIVHTATFRAAAVVISAVLVPVARCAAASHSFEFVAEHLPEAAMDNRFAALPLWKRRHDAARILATHRASGVAHTASGGLTLVGRWWRQPHNDSWMINGRCSGLFF